MFSPVAPPDTAAAAAARARQDTLTKPRGALGRLEDLSVWVSSCQGHCPPTQFDRARIVVFAGDHGVAQSGVSAYPPEVTGQMVANIASGGAAINALAEIAGATVRVVDLAVDADPWSIRSARTKCAAAAAISPWRTRSASRNPRGDRCRPADRRSGSRCRRGSADRRRLGIGNTTAATALVAALTNVEPVAAVGYGTGIDDAGWPARPRQCAMRCSAPGRC